MLDLFLVSVEKLMNINVWLVWTRIYEIICVRIVIALDKVVQGSEMA